MSLLKLNNLPSRSFGGFMEEFLNKSLAEFRGFGNFFSHQNVNIKETDSTFELEVAAPGLKKEDLNVNLDNNLLTISAESKSEHQENKDQYAFQEFNYSSFRRSFQLPDNIDQNAINAKHENGVLTIVLPKKTTVETAAKAIEIS